VDKQSFKRSQVKLIAVLALGVVATWVLVTRYPVGSPPGSEASSAASSSAPAVSSGPPPRRDQCTATLCDVALVTPLLTEKLRVSGIRSLRLRDVTNDTLASLAFAPTIVDLELASSQEKLALDPLAGMNDLRTLTITNSSVASFEPLVSTSIEKLALENVKGVDDLKAVARMPRILELSIKGHVIPTLASLSGGHLRRLSIKSSNVSTLEGIDGIGGIEELVIAQCPIGDLSPIGHVDSLRDLEIGWMPLPDSPVWPKNITTLALVSNHLRDVSFLRAQPQLTELSLLGNNVSDLSPVGSLKDLRSLTLDQNAHVKDLSPLRALVHLESVSLGDTAVESLDPLADLPLKTVLLAHTRVTSLAPLAKIKTLESVEFLPKDFPAAEVDALRKARPKVRISRM